MCFPVHISLTCQQPKIYSNLLKNSHIAAYILCCIAHMYIIEGVESQKNVNSSASASPENCTHVPFYFCVNDNCMPNYNH